MAESKANSTVRCFDGEDYDAEEIFLLRHIRPKSTGCHVCPGWVPRKNGAATTLSNRLSISWFTNSADFRAFTFCESLDDSGKSQKSLFS